MAPDIPNCPKMAPKTAPSGQKAPPRGPEEAKSFPGPWENQCFWLSCLFASDGHPRAQDGSEMAHEGPKRVSREPRDGPKSAPRPPQERPQRRF
eukprot:9483349-Pyramimonas_sp.AAC.1